jgi:hypothetical protein
MDTDFSAFAARIVADFNGVRGCMITSRDGLPLGAHPGDAEEALRPSWLRFSALGEVEKGFLQFAGELWAFVMRGPYCAFAVANTTVRAGLLLESMDQVLLSAVEARNRPDTRIPDSPSIPSGPRTPLHPEVKTPAPQPQPVTQEASPPAHAAASVPAAPAVDPSVAQAPPQAAQQSPQPDQVRPQESNPVPQQPGPARDDPEAGDVDRVVLAAEFARLLEESGYDEDE